MRQLILIIIPGICLVGTTVGFITVPATPNQKDPQRAASMKYAENEQINKHPQAWIRKDDDLLPLKFFYLYPASDAMKDQRYLDCVDFVKEPEDGATIYFGRNTSQIPALAAYPEAGCEGGQTEYFSFDEYAESQQKKEHESTPKDTKEENQEKKKHNFKPKDFNHPKTPWKSIRVVQPGKPLPGTNDDAGWL